MVTWSIWKACNEVVWQQKSPTAASVVLSARSFLDQFRFAQSRTTSSLSNSSIGLSSRVHWTIPISDRIKVNVDGALFNDVSRFGMGCLARNHAGQVLEAFTSSEEGIVRPEIVEIIGIKEALSWIRRHNWQNVLLETDSLVCVQAIQSELYMPSEFGLLVNDCRIALSSLSHVAIQFVERSVNKAVHCLARSSYFSPDRTFQNYQLSPELRNIVLVDFTG
ncbi:uncharacterized protein LOC115703783 [Cannabis sativa]|uniref:uncharacterized protein LOC115703783 n=1 Tax=Cannabis sativa TaxID=3483 RepID=UPI0029CA8E4E|nr:uncharacterized protein LOC115703783 [Cannabis sativa]